MAETSIGMDENIEGALCYVFGWVTGIIFYIIEQKNEFVRFHARQSILAFLPLTVFGWILGFVPVIGWVLLPLLWLLILILWIILMLYAYQGKMYKLPIIGDIAEKGF